MAFGCVVSDVWDSRRFYPRSGFLHDEVPARFDSQKPVQEEPARPDPSEAVEEPEGSQSKQAFEKPLTLNYHKVEKPERKPTVLEWPPQVATNSVVT